MGTISATLAPFLFPVIKMSTDLTNPSSVYLLEDGLELWLAVLHNTKVANAELFELADANLKALLGKPGIKLINSSVLFLNVL